MGVVRIHGRVPRRRFHLHVSHPRRQRAQAPVADAVAPQVELDDGGGGGQRRRDSLRAVTRQFILLQVDRPQRGVIGEDARDGLTRDFADFVAPQIQHLERLVGAHAVRHQRLAARVQGPQSIHITPRV